MSFPDLGIESIKAKVDTGARTSALHAFDLVEFRRGDKTWARFEVHPRQRRSRPAVEVELPLLGRRRVRDSSGRVQERPVVETAIELLGHRWPIEITLTRRDVMGFRLLLGRQAIRRRFIVDPGRSFCGGKRPHDRPQGKTSPP